MNILSLDIDGTVLPFGMDHIPEETVKMINLCVDRGDVVLFNSGRPRAFSLRITRDIHPGKVYLSICNGGAILTKEDQVVVKHLLPGNLFSEMNGKNRKIAPFAYGMTDDIYYFTDSFFLRKEAGLNGSGVHQLKDEKEAENTEMLKILFCEKKEKIGSLQIDYDKSRYVLLHTNPDMMEMMPKEVNKETAIRYIAALYPDREIYAFGDSGNDVNSLKEFHSATFRNGTEECKKAAEYVSPYSQCEGLRDSFLHFGLIGKEP